MASSKGRGAQVRLDGDAQAAARGALGQTLIATQEAKRVLEYTGVAADGTTLDGSTKTGVAAEDEVLAPGGVLVGGGGGGATVTFGQSAGTAAEGNDPRITGALPASVAASTYAPKVSPAFTGTPTAPSPAAGALTLQIPTALWVRQEIAALINSAPGTLDTLGELAAALANNPDFATTTASALSQHDSALSQQAARITTLEAQIASLQSPAVALPNLAAKMDHAQAVPATYFGMHWLGPTNNPAPVVGYGPLRMWDTFGFDATINAYNYGNYWAGIHTAPGVFNWTVFDACLAAYATAGKTGDLIYTLLPHQGTLKPDWVGALGSADYYQRLGEFVSALLVRAAGRIRIWGPVNEPQALYTTAQMLGIAQTVYPLIKAASSSFYVLSPEFVGNGSGNLQAFLTAGGANYFDILAVHLYGKMQPDGLATDGAMYAELAGYKAVMASNGLSDRAVWDTESSEHGYSAYGYATRAEAERAYIAQKLPLLWSEGVDRWYYYANDSDQTLTGHLTTSGAGGTANTTRNEAGIAWDLVRGWMLGKVVGAPTISGSNVSIPLTGSGGYVGRIAWAYKTTGTTTFTAGTFTRAIVADGTEYSIGGAVTSFPTGNLSTLLDNQAASGSATPYSGGGGGGSVAALSPGLMSAFPDLANAAWNGAAGVTKTAAQPDVNAGTTGEGILETATTGSHNITSGSITKAAVITSYTFKTRMKANGRTSVKLGVIRADFGAFLTVYVDLTAGTVVADFASAGWSSGAMTCTASGNGFWEVSWTFTLDASTSFLMQYELQNPQATSSYAGDVTKGVFINGFSLT